MFFFLLLLVTLAIALLCSHLVVRVFDGPISSILSRIISDEISSAWLKYIKFAIYVVGVSGGIRIHELERYITSSGGDTEPIVLTPSRWILEIYRTVIQTLSSVAWMLLVFFLFALIAYVIVQALGTEHNRSS